MNGVGFYKNKSSFLMHLESVVYLSANFISCPFEPLQIEGKKFLDSKV